MAKTNYNGATDRYTSTFSTARPQQIFKLEPVRFEYVSRPIEGTYINQPFKPKYGLQTNGPTKGFPFVNRTTQNPTQQNNERCKRETHHKEVDLTNTRSMWKELPDGETGRCLNTECIYLHRFKYDVTVCKMGNMCPNPTNCIDERGKNKSHPLKRMVKLCPNNPNCKDTLCTKRHQIRCEDDHKCVSYSCLKIHSNKSTADGTQPRKPDCKNGNKCELFRNGECDKIHPKKYNQMKCEYDHVCIYFGCRKIHSTTPSKNGLAPRKSDCSDGENCNLLFVDKCDKIHPKRMMPRCKYDDTEEKCKRNDCKYRHHPTNV